MKKMRLNPDSLKVETFSTSRASEVPGTVHGMSGMQTCGGTRECSEATCLDNTLCCGDITPNTTCDM